MLHMIQASSGDARGSSTHGGARGGGTRMVHVVVFELVVLGWLYMWWWYVMRSYYFILNIYISIIFKRDDVVNILSYLESRTKLKLLPISVR